MSAPTGFPTPRSIDEAMARRLVLVEKLQSIDVQLGDRNKQAASGERVTSDEFWTWRRKALHARRFIVAEVSFLREWIKAQNVAHYTARRSTLIDPDDPISLLVAADRALTSIAVRDSGLPQDVQAAVDAIRAFLEARRTREIIP